MSKTAVATRPAAKQPVANLDDMPVQQAIAQLEDKFAAALPAHIPAARFSRAAMLACADGQIADVAATSLGRKSIYDACLKAASDGLLLDKREAALVKFNTKVGNNWVNLAQYMPMVAGVMKKARNSGEIAHIVCQIVYSNDDFHIDFVTDGAPVWHRPNMADRGEMVGVYAVVKLRDGTWSQPEFMTKEQVDEIRERSKTGAVGAKHGPKGPWVTDYNEMARKTVIRRASKYWPSSTDKDVPLDEWIDKRTAEPEDGGVLSMSIDKRPGRKSAGTAAALLAAAGEDDAADEALPDHDEETGEVIEGELAAEDV